LHKQIKILSVLPINSSIEERSIFGLFNNEADDGEQDNTIIVVL
jgi:hypothetical protein